jgi:hypothetical protein
VTIATHYFRKVPLKESHLVSWPCLCSDDWYSVVAVHHRVLGSPALQSASFLCLAPMLHTGSMKVLD